MVNIANVWQALFNEDLHQAPQVTPHQVRVRCPFHNDHNPSCDVQLEKNQFLCRSCGVGGGIISLICHELNVSADSARAWIRAHC